MGIIFMFSLRFDVEGNGNERESTLLRKKISFVSLLCFVIWSKGGVYDLLLTILFLTKITKLFFIINKARTLLCRKYSLYLSVRIGSTIWVGDVVFIF